MLCVFTGFEELVSGIQALLQKLREQTPHAHASVIVFAGGASVTGH